MPILGIDYDKCIDCMECVKDCPVFLYREDEEGKVQYSDAKKSCILCGHCIAVCPVDAILHEGMGETATFDDIEHPESIVSYQNLYKILRSLRVIRHYKKDKVPDELIEKIINAMLYAATGANIRAENFTIISNPDKLKEISAALREAIESDKMLNSQFARNFKILEKQGRNLMFNAPHLIIVHTSMPMKINYINIGNIITYGRLAAQSLGLGTCYHGWTQLALGVDPSLKKLLKISGPTACGFTLGYPDVKYHRVPPRTSKRIRKI
ncbi:MAG: 4Fe-4S dicluster domain-containing protein [Promethearchaeota archaeon]|nr:MAG: 4Fe-4S dicluster domain-containing protein [Candidatus Lokiarchaeota archaeon]